MGLELLHRDEKFVRRKYLILRREPRWNLNKDESTVMLRTSFSATYLRVLPVFALVSPVHREKSQQADPMAPDEALSNREEGEPVTAF
jgi:hypothetical protein